MPQHQKKNQITKLPSQFGLTNKTCVVTGATKGLGLAILKEFLSADALEIFACSREAEFAAEESEVLSAIARGRVKVFKSDLAQERDRASFLDKIGHKPVNVFVSNVGMNVRKRMEDFESDEYRAIMNTNLESAFDLVQRAYKKGIIGRGTSVIFNTSVAGAVSIQTGSVYAMSKAALNQLTKSLAHEWGSFGVRVNAIAPWYINTELAKQVLKNEVYKKAVIDRTPLGRVGEPREVGMATVFLASDASSYITGHILNIDGGFSIAGFTPPGGVGAMQMQMQMQQQQQIGNLTASDDIEERGITTNELTSKRKLKKLKDKDAPKAALNSFNCFCDNERESIKFAFPNLPGREISRELGKRWHLLSNAQKQPFEELALRDKARYDEEMKNYVPPATAQSLLDEDEQTKNNNQSKKKKKQKRDKNAPKRSNSAYIYFCEQTRPTFNKEEFTSQVDVVKELGARWSALSQADRIPFEEMHERDKLRYEREMVAFKETTTQNNTETIPLN